MMILHQQLTLWLNVTLIVGSVTECHDLRLAAECGNSQLVPNVG